MGTEKSGFSKPLFSVPIGFSVSPWCRMHLFPKYLRKIRLGRESDGLCNLGDRQIAVRQKFLCLIDPPVDQITDRRYSFIACKSMNHIIFIHICQLTQGIQIDLLREMLIEILFNKMTFPRKFVCGGEIRDGDGVAVDQLDQDLKKVLTDVDIIFLFFPELLDQGLGVKKHFFSVGTKIADRVWQKCIVGRTKRDSVQSQNDIFQSIFSVAELRMCHVRIDQYQVVFYNRERIIFCLKNTGSVNDIKKFGESMGMKNTLPVPVIAGFADIEKPDVQPFVG